MIIFFWGEQSVEITQVYRNLINHFLVKSYFPLLRVKIRLCNEPDEVRESAPITTPPSNSTAIIVVPKSSGNEPIVLIYTLSIFSSRKMQGFLLTRTSRLFRTLFCENVRCYVHFQKVNSIQAYKNS